MPFAYDRLHLTREEGADIIRKNYGEAAQKLLLLFEAAYPERNPVDLINLDCLFRMPEIEYIRLRSEINSQTYAYMFNQDLPVDGGRTPWHCSDIPFVFRNTGFTPYAAIPEVRERLEKQIFDSVIAFARTGNPNNPSIPEWDACTPEKETVMLFDADTRTRVNFDHELMSVFFPIQIAAMQKMRAKGENKANIQH